jgi:hypothetical protein
MNGKYRTAFEFSGNFYEWQIYKYIEQYGFDMNNNIIKLNSMVWARERTIPTERPPLVGEVIANFCG